MVLKKTRFLLALVRICILLSRDVANILRRFCEVPSEEALALIAPLSKTQ